MKTITINEEKKWAFNEEELHTIYTALIVRCEHFYEKRGFYPPKANELLEKIDKVIEKLAY